MKKLTPEETKKIIMAYVFLIAIGIIVTIFDSEIILERLDVIETILAVLLVLSFFGGLLRLILNKKDKHQK